MEAKIAPSVSAREREDEEGEERRREEKREEKRRERRGKKKVDEGEAAQRLSLERGPDPAPAKSPVRGTTNAQSTRTTSPASPLTICTNYECVRFSSVLSIHSICLYISRYASSLTQEQKMQIDKPQAQGEKETGFILDQWELSNVLVSP